MKQDKEDTWNEPTSPLIIYCIFFFSSSRFFSTWRGISFCLFSNDKTAVGASSKKLFMKQINKYSNIIFINYVYKYKVT